MFVSCESPVESADYVDTAPCVNGNHYRYALVGIMAASALEDLCTIDLMSRTSPRGQFSIRNLSYADVHKGLAVGFELSWFPIRCEECRGQGHCSFDNTTNVVRCSQPCRIYHISSFNCAMILARDLALRTIISGIIAKVWGDAFASPYERLAAVRQDGSVLDFIDEFVARAAQVPRITDQFYIGFFLNGLKAEIRVRIRSRIPETFLD
ncbi:hypothetical protein GH714_040037 [Hevea brasiliensis]|uniref:Uncharacterized protein n=1 Tax=Hevea brasiliensis TaxID=3981 RepID=A0A6A6MUC1_HEVBR|nr:hypothetical protein GH714_040037 [Hevea brasiliensis]